MPTVTLQAKIYREAQLKNVEKLLKKTLKDLKVEINVLGTVGRRWVQAEVSGEDENVAVKFLAERIGLCPIDFENARGKTLKGYVTRLNESKYELYVDIGIFTPKAVDASIPIQHLQACLVDGRKVALKKLFEIFGFCENMPFHIKIWKIDENKDYIMATLSQKQLEQFKNWVRSLLDRLIVIGASKEEINAALKMARCGGDMIDIEPLGLFEFAIVCKLGTDAAGIIPKIGKILPAATFSVFSSRQILEFVGEAYLQ